MHLGSVSASDVVKLGVERFDSGAPCAATRVYVELVSRSGFPDGQIAVASWAFPPLERGPCEVSHSDKVTVVGYGEAAVRGARDLRLKEFEAGENEDDELEESEVMRIRAPTGNGGARKGDWRSLGVGGHLY